MLAYGAMEILAKRLSAKPRKDLVSATLDARRSVESMHQDQQFLFN